MKIISFYSDKGGVGKTFFNNFFANYLAGKNHTVTIIDTVKGHRGLSSDIYTMRRAQGAEDEDFLQTNPAIIRVEDYNSMTEIAENIKSDFVLIDMVGMSLDTLKFLVRCNFIFIITTGDDLLFDMKTHSAIKEVGKKFSAIKIKMFLNKTDKETFLNKTDQEDGIDYFKTFLPKRDVYSNLLKEDYQRRNFDGELADVFKEIYSVILEH